MSIYEDHKKFYDDIFRQGLSDKAESSGYRSIVPAKEIYEFLDWLKTKKPTGRVLDLGCGAGRYSIVFAKTGYKTTGVDFSKEAIKLAKQIASDQKLDIEYILGDILDLQLEKYDIINDDGCLHHIAKKDWPKYMASIKKASKPGTIIRIKVFSKNCKFFSNGNIIEGNWIKNNNHGTYCFEEHELRQLFQDYEINLLEEHTHSVSKKKKFWFVILTSS